METRHEKFAINCFAFFFLILEDKANCELFPDSGPCTANMPSWFFNGTIGACEVFIYGGCDGNSNRFPSYYDCQDNCHGKSDMTQHWLSS